MSFLRLFWCCHVCRLLNVSYLNPTTNPTPLPNATLNIGAAGCTLTIGAAARNPNYRGCRTQPYLSGQPHATLTVGAAGHGLVGAGGVLGLCPRGLCYVLTARASPSWLALRAHGLDFALTTIK
jgi:hypothetical protein